MIPLCWLVAGNQMGVDEGDLKESQESRRMFQSLEESPPVADYQPGEILVIDSVKFFDSIMPPLSSSLRTIDSSLRGFLIDWLRTLKKIMKWIV